MKSANVLAVCFYVMYIFIIWCDDVPVYLLQHVVFTCNILKFLGRTEILYFTIHHNRIIVYVQFFNQRTNIVHMAFHFEWPFITTTGVSKHTFLCTLIQINGFCYSNLYTLQSCSVQDHITFIFSNIIGNIKIISFFFIFFFAIYDAENVNWKLWHFLSEKKLSSVPIMFWEIFSWEPSKKFNSTHGFNGKWTFLWVLWVLC